MDAKSQWAFSIEFLKFKSSRPLPTSGNAEPVTASWASSRTLRVSAIFGGAPGGDRPNGSLFRSHEMFSNKKDVL
jgi:hypothetical protein